jgi:hypothetical protein
MQRRCVWGRRRKPRGSADAVGTGSTQGRGSADAFGKRGQWLPVRRQRRQRGELSSSLRCVAKLSLRAATPSLGGGVSSPRSLPALPQCPVSLRLDPEGSTPGFLPGHAVQKNSKPGPSHFLIQVQTNRI